MSFQPRIRAPRRSFQLNIGLEEGYDGLIVHTSEDVERLIAEWMRGRMKDRLSLVTGGTVITGNMLYAWQSGSQAGRVNTEPTAIFFGEINPIYNAKMADEEAIEALTDLATFIGRALRQVRMYLLYKEEIIVLQDAARTHPTGT